MKKKSVARIITAIMIASVMVSGCGNVSEVLNAEAEEDVLNVNITSSKRGNINLESEYLGTLSYAEEVEVFPMLSGEVTATYFEEGDYVNAGDLLFTLDDEAYQLQLENAQLTYSTAQVGANQQIASIDMQRESAVNSLASAYEGVQQTQDSYYFYTTQINDADATLQDLKNDRNEMQGDLDELRDDRDDMESDVDKAEDANKSAMTAYMSAMGMNAAIDSAKSEMDRTEQVVNYLSRPGSTATQQEIDEAQLAYDEAVGKYNALLAAPGAHYTSSSEMMILQNAATGASSAYTGLSTAYNQMDSGVTSMEQGLDTYDSSIRSARSAEYQLIFQRDNLQYTYQQALRGVDLAQANLDYFNNYTAPGTITTAQNTVNQAAIAVESAQMQLDYTKVTSPVSGFIKSISVEEYGMAQAGYTAYTIVTEDQMEVEFGVPESVCRALTPGQVVSIDRNGTQYTGKVSEIPISVNPNTGLFTVTALVEGDTSMLTPGTSVSVSTVTQHADNVITIPVDCVYYESGKAYTYVVDGDVARKVYMETGLYDTDNIEIISGLGENASVITTWSSDLRDGLPIEVSGGESGSTELNSHNEMGIEVIDLTISVNSAL